MVEDLDLFCLAQENNKRGLTNPLPYVIIKKKRKERKKMDTMIILELLAGFTLLGIAEIAERLFDINED